MVIGLLVAGAVLVVAGLAAIGFGIPVRDFSLGSTLMVTGVTALCGGVIVLALAAAVRELQAIAQRLGSGAAVGMGQVTSPSASATSPRAASADGGGFSFTRDQPPSLEAPPPPPTPPTAPSASAPPWHEEATQRGARDVPPPAPPAAAPEEPAAAPKRRNLLFSSTSRKERERAQARTAEPLPPDLLSADLRPNPPAVPPAAEPSEPPPPATFDDAWPKPERSRSVDVAPRRPARPITPPSEANGTVAPSPAHPPVPAEQPPVTVLKSGVVDGMAYSLYSDGSIEAQMPEGMMRFASIDELRSHLDQR